MRIGSQGQQLYGATAPQLIKLEEFFLDNVTARVALPYIEILKEISNVKINVIENGPEPTSGTAPESGAVPSTEC